MLPPGAGFDSRRALDVPQPDDVHPKGGSEMKTGDLVMLKEGPEGWSTHQAGAVGRVTDVAPVDPGTPRRPAYANVAVSWEDGDESREYPWMLDPVREPGREKGPRYVRPYCPECGTRAIGEVQWVSGVALFIIDEDGRFIDWAGDTELDWNSQLGHYELHRADEGDPVERALLNCGRHEWTSKYVEE